VQPTFRKSRREFPLGFVSLKCNRGEDGERRN
jgi:hypothetical protein